MTIDRKPLLASTVEREALLETARALGFPAIPLRRGVTVAAGADAWARFTSRGLSALDATSATAALAKDP